MIIHSKITFLIIATLFFITQNTLLASAAQLTISHSASMPPLSFLDDNGNPQGIIIDIWQLWSEETGIDVVFKLSNWDQALTSVANGDTDVHGGLFYTKERADKLHYSDKFFNFSGGLFVSKKLTDFKIDNLDNLNCGVIKEDFSKKFMEDNFPYVSLVIYDSCNKLIEAATQDRVQTFIADFPVAMHHLNKLGAENNFSYYKLFTKPIRPAVSKKHIDKLKPIVAGMNSIPKIKMERIIHKWLTLEKTSPGWTIPATVILLGIAFILILLFHKTDILRVLRSKKN
ncbi:ABC-type amino acid transport substrate-binding protein [Maridesulfovibrio ferrireducens]|uniref:ABC-type amino acid transport substrate-binding protein n=1 Tax=Maridesulfovibrio ferrireducens TaxID=246191 RepID=A0A1G9FAP5_9BACT|nr:transporter substrate-binding domain-containing protein [Maridesulfovibrio ferrireducens]SDK85411.1 ABC-type amino acid transport substrate-binding protein [Maridesulfovibrio ferrireducens]